MNRHISCILFHGTLFKSCIVPVRLLGLNPRFHHLTLMEDYYRPGAVARGSTSQREFSESKALLSDVCIWSMWFLLQTFQLPFSRIQRHASQMH